MRPDDDTRSPYQAPQNETVQKANPTSAEAEGEFSRTNQRFVALLGERGGPMTAIWVGLALFSLVLSLVQYATPTPQENTTGLLIGTAFFIVLSLLSYGLFYGSISSMRLCDARDGDITLEEAARKMTDNLFFATVTSLVYFVTTFIGSIFLVIPGLIATVLFMMAPFYSAHYGEGPLQAMGSSFTVMLRHWTLPVIIFLGTLVLGMVVLIPFALFMPGDLSIVPDGSLLGVLLQWGITSVFGYFAWLYVGSMIITIDESEERLERGKQPTSDPFVAQAQPATAPKMPDPIEIDEPNW